jgi:hypothetical protein
MAPMQAGEPQQSAGRPGSRGKKALWTAVVAVTVVLLGGYLAVLAYVRFGGTEVRDFCARELAGKSPGEVKELARRSGLETAEGDGWIRVTTNRHMSRHTCHLKLDGGNVKSAVAYFRF